MFRAAVSASLLHSALADPLQQRRRSGHSMPLTSLPDTTKCLDGTPAGYYSSVNKASDVWVIFLEGGGGCWNVADCSQRTRNHLGSSKKWSSTYDASATHKGTIDGNCDENPDFCDASHVYVAYCSGDLHSGQRSNKHEGFYMAGHLNFKAIIEDLLATTSLSSAKRVLLTGTSAGGVGVFHNADFLTSMLPGVTVKAAPIAGWFFPDTTEDHPDQSWMIPSTYEDYTAGKASDPELALAGWAAQQAWSDSYHGNCPSSEGVKCANVPTLAAYVRTPTFISENMWDKYHFQKLYNVSIDSSTWKWSVKKWVTYYAQAMQASTGRIGALDGNGLFLPACIDHIGHVGGSDGRAKRAVIDGHDYFEVLADWFYDRGQLSHVLTDSCDTVQSCLDKLEAQCPSAGTALV